MYLIVVMLLNQQFAIHGPQWLAHTFGPMTDIECAQSVETWAARVPAFAFCSDEAGKRLFIDRILIEQRRVMEGRG